MKLVNPVQLDNVNSFRFFLNDSINARTSLKADKSPFETVSFSPGLSFLSTQATPEAHPSSPRGQLAPANRPQPQPSEEPRSTA